MTDPNTTWAAPEGSPATSPATEGSPAPTVAPTTAPERSQVTAPAPSAPSPIAAPKKKSGALVNAVLVVGALVAVGGLAFAAGRSTAPAPASGARGGQGAAQGVTQGGGQGPQGGMAGASFDPAQAGPGGMRGGGDRTMLISGTVSQIDGTTLVITTESGTETEIDVSGATYHAQAAASASDVTVGSEVSVAVEGLGLRRPESGAAPAAGGEPAAGSGTVTATEVTISSAE